MAATGSNGTIRVWDPLIRIGHWVLVAAFATAYLTEGEPEWLHTWAGYAIAATVLLRIVWGFVGPKRARFSDFVTGPGRVVAYLKGLVSGKAERHIGHSPAGGAMTVALLLCLAVTAVSGMGRLAAEEGRGPLAGIVAAAPEGQGLRVHGEREDHEEYGEGREHGEGDEEEGFWAETHEIAANLTLALILLHIAGVFFASYAHRENLARAMVTGAKRA
ncbi:cytochrome b/b6 domain-containing protein [Rhodobium gokarnense]|uniref:Cytochrome b n=1 Tax=Rhodobium gokarnense TaxID=364296 RepID=A0ABT3HFA1_9HYPH|nr:cytochrome b/b6 domain-containing protein [Rhodobium gokarnense]MCW2309067.1 cytochrome b [Rhodobium gokarnense]